jgi:hypothetical protein
MALPITGGSGSSQYQTSSPQIAGQGNAGGTRVSNLQPGTSESLLKGTGEVQLKQNTLPSVALAPISTHTTTAKETKKPVQPAHHIDWALLSIAVVLLAAAALVFWLTSRAARSEKNTTI